jgi:hypothetical protein
MAALYRDELEDMLRARDTAMARLVEADGQTAYKAGHTVLAMIPIDLDANIESVSIA